MNVEEIMNSGELYKVGELTDAQGHYYEYLQMMEEYNAAGYTKEGLEKKERILHELFAEVGEGAYIQAPYYAMWGGHHVYLGKGVYINYNSVLVDDAEIHIGDNSIIAAGAIVTRDIPANVIPMGNPAKVYREITEDDEMYYDHGKLIEEHIIGGKND